jgi:hypothetical protein
MKISRQRIALAASWKWHLPIQLVPEQKLRMERRHPQVAT